MKSFVPVNEKEFETASQTRKHQITWPIGIRISPSLRGKATSFLITSDMGHLGQGFPPKLFSDFSQRFALPIIQLDPSRDLAPKDTVFGNQVFIPQQ